MFDPIIDQSAESWSVSLGQWHGVDVRLHIHFPLLALIVFFFASQSPHVSYRIATMGLLILLGSVLFHELVRLLVAHRLGGRMETVILGPTGGWALPVLPADPPALLVTALLGPLTHLALLVVAACGLVLSGEQQMLGLLNPLAPTLLLDGPPAVLAVQLVVWINGLLLLVNLLPIDPLDGANILRGLLWPNVGRAAVSGVVCRFALACAALSGGLAVYFHQVLLNNSLPAWFPLGLLTILLAWGANRENRKRRNDLGLAIDQFDSDDELWLSADWLDDDTGASEDREAVLVEHLQDKQQEVLDRKRREQEASEDARVDAILARLNQCSLDDLSDEDRTILKRASRRYRRRFGKTDC